MLGGQLYRNAPLRRLLHGRRLPWQMSVKWIGVNNFGPREFSVSWMAVVFQTAGRAIPLPSLADQMPVWFLNTSQTFTRCSDPKAAAVARLPKPVIFLNTPMHSLCKQPGAYEQHPSLGPTLSWCPQSGEALPPYSTRLAR